MQNVRIGSHSVHQLHVYLVWCANRKVIAQKADTTKDKEAIKQLVTNYKAPGTDTMPKVLPIVMIRMQLG